MPLFVYKSMDLNKMEQKVMAHKYKCIEEFLADAHNVLHNMVLVYGGELIINYIKHIKVTVWWHGRVVNISDSLDDGFKPRWASHCFFEQESLHSLLSTGWFQERI